MPSETFGTRLAKLREARNLSQRRLGRESGIAQQAVNLIERDLREPSLSTILALAAGLGVPPGQLVNGLARP